MCQWVKHTLPSLSKLNCLYYFNPNALVKTMNTFLKVFRQSWSFACSKIELFFRKNNEFYKYLKWTGY